MVVTLPNRLFIHLAYPAPPKPQSSNRISTMCQNHIPYYSLQNIRPRSQPSSRAKDRLGTCLQDFTKLPFFTYAGTTIECNSRIRRRTLSYPPTTTVLLRRCANVTKPTSMSCTANFPARDQKRPHLLSAKSQCCLHSAVRANIRAQTG